MSRSRVVLDTNVFVAAGFNPASRSARLLEAVRDGDLAMIWHERTKRETETIIGRIPPLRRMRIERLFRPENECREPLDLAAFAAVEDADDRKFAALSQQAGATLITSDDHLLSRRDLYDIVILTPREFRIEDTPEQT